MLLWARLILVLAVAGHWGLQCLGDRLEDFWVGAAIHGVATLSYIYLCGRVVRRTWNPSFVEAFGLVVLLRLLVLPLEPALSDDIFRYLHEGHMVLERHNPYLTAPEYVDEALRLATYERINHAHVPAAYPPLVQLCLALGYTLTPTALGMKLVFGGFDLLAFVLLWVWLPTIGVSRGRAVIYGLCPLVVLEFTGEGHSDSLVIAMILLMLWAFTIQRRTLVGVFLAFATLSKILPIVFLPFAARETRRTRLVWGSFAAVLALFYIPLVADAVSRQRSVLDLFEGTRLYGDLWRHNDSVFHLCYLVCDGGMQTLNSWLGTELSLSEFPHRVAKVPIALIGLGLLVRAWTRRWSLPKVSTAFFLYFVACSPTMHPWYLALLVPWLCIYPSNWILVFTGTIYIAHSVPGRDHVEGGMKFLEYLPFYLGLVILLRNAPSNPSPDRSPDPDQHQVVE